MGIATEKYIRKPLYVDAVRVTAENFDEIVPWCQGEVLQDEIPGEGTTKPYIKIRVHNPKNPRQTKAFVGDWILYTERGYKIYTAKAFHAAFDLVNDVENVPVGPNPAQEKLVVEEAQVNGNTGQVGPQPGASVSSAPAQVSEPHRLAESGVFERPHLRKVASDQDIAAAMLKDPEARTKLGIDPVQPDNVEAQPKQEPIDPAAAEGKRVLSIEEQRKLSVLEVQELIRSGEAVLAQDIAQP